MKASLDFFNWLYWLLGAAVLGAGIYVHVVYQWGSQLLGISLSLAIIIAGAVIVGLTLLGCWGVRTDWWMVLNTVRVRPAWRTRQNCADSAEWSALLRSLRWVCREPLCVADVGFVGERACSLRQRPVGSPLCHARSVVRLSLLHRSAPR
eukprot:c16426_g1_i1.p2 GENE.c16426_g1_i1~~c16426_g1_i1.p2  ORF type:complete len:175 (+),score=8.92 c16426_g1_i1:78-527(+)